MILRISIIIATPVEGFRELIFINVDAIDSTIVALCARIMSIDIIDITRHVDMDTIDMVVVVK